MGENDSEWTPAEQEIIDIVAERKGREYAEEHAELALKQAELVGVLKPEDRSQSKSEDSDVQSEE
ncbi:MULTISPECIES: hypothetical protein [Haloferax]|uniref:Uncharacterized protein n=1 Tax=Haloferax marinum TaxID=2666143 RepID=A0A6A8G9R5_9EURY|nr:MULTISPECIES: hypothetical protein [Haloferax]KAB1198347.1 hypothetical protein Hfx1150_12820 [Haloferax sp. CBA1150]MRW97445.1 hypothetical protein [Haloferax marinum]